jgi:GNAT superfamily N-acetyltransferase
MKRIFKFETARTPKKIAKFAEIIIQHNLHIGGLMSAWASPSYLQNVKAITIVTKNEFPIAAGIRVYQSEYPMSLNTGIYVKERYRRQGIGSNIFNRLNLPDINYVVGKGAYGSIPFYEKQKPKLKEKLVLNWASIS